MSLEEKIAKYNIYPYKTVKMELPDYVFADKIIQCINDFSKRYNVSLGKILFMVGTKYEYGEECQYSKIEANISKSKEDLEMEIAQKENNAIHQQKLELAELARLKQKYESKT